MEDTFIPLMSLIKGFIQVCNFTYFLVCLYLLQVLNAPLILILDRVPSFNTGHHQRMLVQILFT